MGAKKAESAAVTWKWLAVAAFGILITAGGGWLSYVQSQINGLVVAMDADRKDGTKAAVEAARTQEKVTTIEKKVEQVDKKIDEILRLQQRIQDRQERDEPPPQRFRR